MECVYSCQKFSVSENMVEKEKKILYNEIKFMVENEVDREGCCI